MYETALPILVRPVLPSVLRWFKDVRGSDAIRCTSSFWTVWLEP
jgi:hypothetical protein